ncbi:sugar ABC transporter substrate-binding protein [Sediminibacillus albus]|uniref:Maltodextrin-binding protein n=1 Tax=Sediminibacillus albus TaxID=407036 RepID=A0A1G9C8B1_9BACI|nr:extracellular solute-binding protein [Sediminibacillus albus]SDK47843.1 arabinogalactan oligomer / maltooligosaccharide transport system substrate-binding protein [Sediminibacillus albus]
MKRRVSLLSFVGLFALLLLLAACAPDREEEAGSSNAEEGTAEKPEKLTIWANDEEEQLQAIEDIAADYEEQEGITVEVVPKSMLEQEQELSLAGPEGKGPDLFFQPHDRIGNIVAQGLAEPLNLTDEQVSGYSEAAMEAVTYNYEGQTDQYGVPMVFETYGIFYNTDIIAEAPQTIDDLQAALEEHTDTAKETYGFLMKPNDLYFTYPFFKNYGGYIFGGDTGEYDTADIGLNNEGAKQGGELFQSFFGQGKIPASTTSDVIDGLFTEGKVGAVINGPWSIPGYREALGDSLAFAPFPSINGGPGETLVGVKSWMVSYYSKNKDWATDLALFLTNEKNLQHYYEVAGELPPNTKALEALEDPIHAAFAEQIEHGVPMPSTPQMAQVWEPMNNALQFLAEGEDVQPVLDEAVEQIKANIEASGQ